MRYFVCSLTHYLFSFLSLVFFCFLPFLLFYFPFLYVIYLSSLFLFSFSILVFLLFSHYFSFVIFVLFSTFFQLCFFRWIFFYDPSTFSVGPEYLNLCYRFRLQSAFFPRLLPWWKGPSSNMRFLHRSLIDISTHLHHPHKFQPGWSSKFEECVDDFEVVTRMVEVLYRVRSWFLARARVREYLALWSGTNCVIYL